jgi:pimeloyl-ACP methyl ester carboxylesterase
MQSHAVAFFQGFFNWCCLSFFFVLYYVLYAAQDGLIYHPRVYTGRYTNYYARVEERAKEKLKYTNNGVVRRVTYDVPGVGRQTAYWIPPPQDAFETCGALQQGDDEAPSQPTPPLRVWLAYGGNAALAMDWLAFAAEYMSSTRRTSPPGPVSFFLVDYPGYGRNKGAPTPDGILQETDLALEALEHKMRVYFQSSKQSDCYPLSKNNFFQISMVGHSLGCAAALQYGAMTGGSRARHVDKYVLVSPFTSMLEMTKQVVGPLPFVKYILRHDFDNVEKLGKVANCTACSSDEERQVFARRGVSIKILHGDRDEIVPAAMGKALYEYGKKHYGKVMKIKHHVVRGAGHNNILSVAQSKIFKAMDKV